MNLIHLAHIDEFICIFVNAEGSASGRITDASAFPFVLQPRWRIDGDIDISLGIRLGEFEFAVSGAKGGLQGGSGRENGG